MKELTRDEALDIYYASGDLVGIFYDGTQLRPGYWLSTRTDANDGWCFRNTHGWLATVYDDTRVESKATYGDGQCTIEDWLEGDRGTSAEAFDDDSVYGSGVASEVRD